MSLELWFLAALVYGIVETLEKFGLRRRFAHLLAIPLGVLSSFSLLTCNSPKDYILKGLVIGISAIGVCDTTCNIVDIARTLLKKG